MNEQYAARMAVATELPIRHPTNIVKRIPNLPDYDQQEPIVITNMPSDGAPLPSLPDREPVR
jgi:hypothetical protein